MLVTAGAAAYAESCCAQFGAKPWRLTWCKEFGGGEFSGFRDRQNKKRTPKLYRRALKRKVTPTKSAQRRATQQNARFTFAGGSRRQGRYRNLLRARRNSLLAR